MKEAWDEHIQPVLDSYRWDNFSSIADPFLESYPQFMTNQKIEIEDTLIRCAFNDSDGEMAQKALTIAEALHTSQLATGGLARLMRVELRKQLDTLDMNRDIAKDYVLAFSTFGLTEAVPFIQVLVDTLSEVMMPVESDELEASYRALLRVCCLSLRRLMEERAGECIAILVDHDLRLNTLTTTELHNLSPERIINSWDHLGLSGLRSITGLFHGMQADQRLRAIPLLEEAARGIDFQSDRERQEVMDLVDGLRNTDEVLTASRPDERMRRITRKQSTQGALTGFVLSLFALGAIVTLLVLLNIGLSDDGQSLIMPIRGTIYGVIATLISVAIGFISAFSTLHNIRTYRANRIAFVLAILTLAVCMIVFIGFGVFAYVMLLFDW
jgi:hypothetical protein